jgi:hypothetical protein
MPTLRTARSLAVAVPEAELRARVAKFADLYGLRPGRDTGHIQEFQRGGLFGELFSFDIQSVPTTLRAEFQKAEEGTEVTITLAARTRFGVFTSGDRAALEKQLDVLASMVGE